jgi:hypothetical protein
MWEHRQGSLGDHCPEREKSSQKSSPREVQLGACVHTWVSGREGMEAGNCLCQRAIPFIDGNERQRSHHHCSPNRKLYVGSLYSTRTHCDTRARAHTHTHTVTHARACQQHAPPVTSTLPLFTGEAARRTDIVVQIEAGAVNLRSTTAALLIALARLRRCLPSSDSSTGACQAREAPAGRARARNRCAPANEANQKT